MTAPLLARSRSFVLRSGAELLTPLLVPSVTSKGFQLREDGLSEVATYLEVTRDHLTEALLLSAYDVHHRLLPDVDRLLSDEHWATLYSGPSLLIVDSGGYELGAWWNDSDLRRQDQPSIGFTMAEYESLVDLFPRDRDGMLVSYDYVGSEHKRGDYGRQIADAAAFFARRADLMSDLLLKPSSGHRFVSVGDLAPHAAALASFDVVGVTEHELGGTLLDRLTTVAKLRGLLDTLGVPALLHIFGVLDPILVSLYFMAGAEMFDGLTWLRYGYYRGVSVNRSSIAVLENRLDSPDAVVGAAAQVEYLVALANQKRALRRWTESGGDFSLLPEFRAELQHAYGVMMHRLEREEA